MSGVAGHMAHIHEDLSLTFGDVKDIFTKASRGEIIGTEKTDGQNLFLSFSVVEQQAKAARNKGNLKSGGLSVQGLADKFEGRGDLQKSFVEGMKAFETAVKKIPQKTQEYVFGLDANIFYNVEIQDPRQSNVIKYDTKNLTIHRTGHGEFDKETGNKLDTDVSDRLEMLEAYISAQKFAQNQHRVSVNAIVSLRSLSDGTALQKAIDALNLEMSKHGLEDSNTLGEYMILKVKDWINFRLEEAGLILDESIKLKIIKRMAGVEKTHMREIVAGLEKEQAQVVKALIAQAGSIFKNFIKPIEHIIHFFAVDMLHGLESAFILDNDTETARLRQEVSSAIKAIENSNSEKAMEHLQIQLQRLVSADTISTAVEGFVFQYKGNYYKFTGNFAPINQILGLFKYGRGSIPPIEKKNLNEWKKISFIDNEILKEGIFSATGVALYPGKFKPPHAGHYAVVKALLEHETIENVIIIISRKEHDNITAEDSKNIWDIYTANDSNIFCVFSDEIEDWGARSPISTIFNYVSDIAPAGQTIAVVLGEKDVEDGRFSRLMAIRTDVNIKQVAVSPQAGGISATLMRNYLKDSNLEEFHKGLPEHLTNDEKNSVWSLLVQNLINKKPASGIKLKEGEENKESHFQSSVFHGLIFELVATEIASRIDYQKRSRRIKQHSNRKNKLLGTRNQKRSKSAPPVAPGGLEEMSAMASGAVSGAASGSRRKKKRKRNSLIREKDELMESVYNYIICKLQDKLTKKLDN